MTTSYVAELSDEFGIIRTQPLNARTLLAAKRDASRVFADAAPGRTLTVCEHVRTAAVVSVRPLAARLSGDRRRSDWVIFE